MKNFREYITESHLKITYMIKSYNEDYIHVLRMELNHANIGYEEDEYSDMIIFTFDDKQDYNKGKKIISKFDKSLS